MNSPVQLKTRLETFGNSLDCNRIALTDLTQSLSYQALFDQVSELAQWLRANNVAMLALHSDNNIDWVVIDLACQQAEVKCIPLPDFFSPQQLLTCLEDTLVDLILTGMPELLKGIIKHHETVTAPCSLTALKLSPELRHADLNVADQRCPTHTQKITFTSGSTGAPKGVCLTTEHQWSTAKALASTIGIQNPKHLCLLPLATLLENIAGVYAPLLNHGTIVLPSGAERGLNGSSGLDIPQLLHCISSIEPNTLILIPQLLNALVMACEQGWTPPKSILFIAVGGAKVAPQLLSKARSLGLPIYEGYGLSECCSVVTLNTPNDQRNGTVGKPLPHCKIANAGENIVVLEPIFQGYYDDRESWYQKEVYTGDLGHFNDGYLSISGRYKNVIISSFGRNINPEWVESELLSKATLSHCIVVGENRPYLGAFIDAPDSISDLQVQQWITTVNNRLPDYAQVKTWQRLAPEQWRQLLTANGRPQRQRLHTTFSQQIDDLYKGYDNGRESRNTSHANMQEININLNECL